MEGNTRAAFRELLGDIREIIVVSDDAAMNSWDIEHERLWEDDKNFHYRALYAIKTVLSHESPKLESLIMADSCSDFRMVALDLFCKDESAIVVMAP